MLSRHLILILVAVSAIRAEIVPTNFKWQAHLDRNTGIATSCEESSALFSVPHSVSSNRIACHAEKIIQDYPKFLSKPSLTMGLLKTNGSLGKKSDLCTSIYSLNLLTFGCTRSTSRTICNKLAKKYSAKPILSLEIPILGGLLSQSNANDAGCLRFTLLRKAEISNNILNVILVTEIAGRYKPSIAGTSIPRNRVRSAAYCATQRMFHEYVMWRFHRLFTNELNGSLNSKPNNINKNLTN